MNGPAILDVWQAALTTMLYAGGPFLAASLATGVLMSVLQAATQLQENMLSFVPKLLAVVGVFAWGGATILQVLVGYFGQSADMLEALGRPGAF